MHPVNYLFEDIYRNDWSITSNAVTRDTARQGRPVDPRSAFSRGAQAELIGTAFSGLSIGSIQVKKGA
ncbi:MULTISPECIES: hypothetical protein [unclassified Mesorhizobium]|uniref:hypothetical protein n=1 Tax=unclassified Mesorhizobium TaxID=325217 RepID=UPI0013E00C2F|nr:MULTISPECIES: hypothetical protein [unclassified Mesorhizobium]